MIKKFILLVLFFIPFLANAEVVKFSFISSAQKIKPNQISGVLTIQAQDASGNQGNTAQTVCLSLTTTSSTGEFSSSNTNWNSVSVLTMNKGSANRNFYYKDSSSGEFVLLVKAAPRPETETRPCASWSIDEWSAGWEAKQNILVGESVAGLTESETPSQDVQTQTVESSLGVQTALGESFPVEPQIFASAGPDKIVIVGVDEKFTGSSIGLKKEPLENARYLWSFGDGSIREGVSVLHNYKYPGEYIVVLDVASGKYSASDRLIVKAVASQLKISEVNAEFVRLSNGSMSEINISNWLLSFNGINFIIPETTIIRAKNDLIIPNTISGLKINNKKDPVKLLYPNTSVAYVYNGLEPVAWAAKNPVVKTAVVAEVKKEQMVEPAQNTVAGVIYSEPKDKISNNPWLLPTAGVGILAALGYISIKKQKQKEEPVVSQAGDDFTIDEDKF